MTNKIHKIDKCWNAANIEAMTIILIDILNSQYF